MYLVSVRAQHLSTSVSLALPHSQQCSAPLLFFWMDPCLLRRLPEDATQKAFCGKEMKETKAKKEDKTAEDVKLSTKKEQKKAQSKKLEEEVATLQKELAEIASTQAKMDTSQRGEG